MAHAEHGGASADFSPAFEPFRQLHHLLARTHEVVECRHRHESEADGEQHLIKVRLFVHAPVERRFHQRTQRRH